MKLYDFSTALKTSSHLIAQDYFGHPLRLFPGPLWDQLTLQNYFEFLGMASKMPTVAETLYNPSACKIIKCNHKNELRLADRVMPNENHLSSGIK